MEHKITAIVLAAGQGTRMNTSVAKQFLTLRDKPVLFYSLKAFEDSAVNDIILVTGKEQVEYCKSIVRQYELTKVSCIIEGGKERYDSVYRGLLRADGTDYVLIHDGARPFITPDIIKEIIDQVRITKACLIGTQVKETIKMINSEGVVISTPNRNTLWAAQTPQAFQYDSIMMSYQSFYEEPDKERLGITDDAMLYELYRKLPVKMLQGDYRNIKLTTPEDLLLAEKILDQMNEVK
ncbi:MAG: ispD [Herbinix sp.]|jgi:2-C-methyl-D-erythritol 4-phosphate cytidylyltransferase|nr:ispD [Herbinix sp.]